MTLADYKQKFAHICNRNTASDSGKEVVSEMKQQKQNSYNNCFGQIVLFLRLNMKLKNVPTFNFSMDLNAPS